MKCNFDELMVGWLRMYSIQGFLTWQSKLLMKYKHLSQAERYQIYALMKAGHDQTQIAKLLYRHKSTISRELNRNTGYRGIILRFCKVVLTP